ncbi:MAG TPA: hypothetical protein VMV73_03790 [Candidatus Dormibacteraeota bacterium]|nr:hypothetical protein [Candidatus Dormibacteraeota bacterium]
MPRPFFIAAALLALALAACNSQNYVTTSTATPTASPTTAPTFNPSITAATVEVTTSGVGTPNVIVSLCASAGCSLPANVLQQLTTNSKGEVTFAGLTPGTTYCFVNSVTSGTSTTTYQDCTAYWQNSSTGSPLKLGT